MGAITGFEASRMLGIERNTIVDGEIVGTHLILTRFDGTTIDAGVVQGAAGLNGKTPIFRGVSDAAFTVGTGSKTFALNPAMNVAFVIGSVVRASSSVNPNNFMIGYVTAATTVSVTINVTAVGGSGLWNGWILTLSGFQGPPGSISVSPAGGVLVGNYPDPGLAPDAVGTDNIQDGSVTREKLAVGSGAGGPDLITSFLQNAPLIFAHRGAHNLYPENSLEGLRATAQAGFAAELDLRFLSSGQAVALHDATVDRTMTGTGAVSGLDLADWRALAIKPQIQNGQQAMGALWEDILSDLGGRYLLVPEVKIAGTQAAVIAPVVDRGLQRSVIFQSFDLVTAQAIATAGCVSMLLVGTTLTGISEAALKGSGVDFIGFDKDVSAASITAAHAAGLVVAVYTVDSSADYTEALVTNNADGVFTDDPWFVSGRYNVKSSDPFQARDAWPHLVGYTNAAGVIGSGTLSTTRIQYAPPIGLRRYNYAQDGDNATLAIALGWAGQSRGPKIRARFTTMFMEEASGQTRWAGMFIGTQSSPDDVFHDSAYAGQNGYHCLVRRNGAIDIWRVAPGVAPSLLIASATPGVALAAANARSQPTRFEVVIGTSNVTFTNLTSAVSVTAADNSFRGPSRVDLSANGTDVEWSSIGIEDLV